MQGQSFHIYRGYRVYFTYVEMYDETEVIRAIVSVFLFQKDRRILQFMQLVKGEN